MGEAAAQPQTINDAVTVNVENEDVTIKFQRHGAFIEVTALMPIRVDGVIVERYTSRLTWNVRKHPEILTMKKAERRAFFAAKMTAKQKARQAERRTAKARELRSVRSEIAGLIVRRDELEAM